MVLFLPVRSRLDAPEGGHYLTFSGKVRIKADGQKNIQIDHVELRIKVRMGSTDYGECAIKTHFIGAASRFDDSFEVSYSNTPTTHRWKWHFYGFLYQLSAETSISLFVVDITFSDGSSHSYDNIGVGFQVQDNVIFEFPGSSLEFQSEVNGTPKFDHCWRSQSSFNYSNPIHVSSWHLCAPKTPISRAILWSGPLLLSNFPCIQKLRRNFEVSGLSYQISEHDGCCSLHIYRIFKGYKHCNRYWVRDKKRSLRAYLESLRPVVSFDSDSCWLCRTASWEQASATL